MSRLNLTPGKYILNDRGDLGIFGGIRAYFHKEVELVKKCKSGEYQIRTSDGKLFTVCKRNLDTAEELEARKNAPPVDFSDWTIEEMEDVQPQHGLDLEQEIMASLIDELKCK